MNEKTSRAKLPGLTDIQVLEYLRAHPQFLTKHPELLEVLSPPERDLGESVVDFQQFQLKNLQSNTKSLKEKYAGLVDFCRDNLSVQGQVHAAVLRLVRVRSLEQLLEVLTLDLLSLFDLDVVRLAVESDAAGAVDSYYSEDNFSGIVFIEPGTVDAALNGRHALLIADTSEHQFPGFERVFADCESLIESCAVLRLTLEDVPRNVLLAFGVRYKDRYHPGQGIDLLAFLADVVAHQLDTYLKDMDEPA